jgi:CheY-like chemotaxis protein
MPSHVIERVFEPFFTTKEVGAGSGLGLSMVYGFVKQSGGHITVTSEEGQGSTVHLYLPKSEAVANQPDERPVTKDPVARGEIVLLVEDDEDVRQFIATGLSRLGYEVLEAGNGETALAVLHGAPRVDLLLCDVVLPGDRNGPEIVEEAQNYRPGLKSLFISGYAAREMSHQIHLPEGAELLIKPFHLRDLANTVRALLDA